jgi:hypothetical protein
MVRLLQLQEDRADAANPDGAQEQEKCDSTSISICSEFSQKNLEPTKGAADQAHGMSRINRVTDQKIEQHRSREERRLRTKYIYFHLED